MISVVIPVFNGAHVVPTTVPAILALDGVDEILWVDDGSTDDTAAQISKRIDAASRARLIQMGRNQGRSAARNAGLRASTGDVLLFLDADVQPQVDAAQRLTEALAAPEAVASVARLGLVADHPDEPYQDYASTFPRGPAPTLQPGAVLDWRFFLSGACAVRRDALEAVGAFNESIAYGEDVELACRLARAAPTGLRLARTTVGLHDLGTLADALDRADMFGHSLLAFDPVCRRRTLGRISAVPGVRTVSRIAAPALRSLVDRLAPGRARRRVVRYLLASRILSARRA